MVRISDARMSGTAYGTVVLHVTPEAAVGGPLGLVRNGDRIKLSVKDRRLDLLVDANELERRRKGWKSVSAIDSSRGYAELYFRHVLQAEQGCDFDFLRHASLRELTCRFPSAVRSAAAALKRGATPRLEPDRLWSMAQATPHAVRNEVTQGLEDNGKPLLDHEALAQALRSLGMLYGASQPLEKTIAGASDEAEAIRVYIERERPHLLSVYDLDTLVKMVQAARESKSDPSAGVEQFSPK